MRIAVCLSGKTGGLGRDGTRGDLALEKLSQNFRTHITSELACALCRRAQLNDNFDIFIHSWTTHLRDKILKFYNPVDHLIEAEKFDTTNATLRGRDVWSPEMFYSRWYSQCRAVDLMSEHSSKNNIEYDLVFLMRFDCGWRHRFEFEKLDPNVLYTCGHHKQRSLIIDWWFASKQKNILEFSKLVSLFLNLGCGLTVDLKGFSPEGGRLTPQCPASSHFFTKYIKNKQKNVSWQTMYTQRADCFLARHRSDIYGEPER